VSGETKATRFCDCLQPEFCVRYKLAQPTFTNTHKYQIVQPAEILDFYRDLALAGDCEIEVAGSLGGGRRVWALAKLNESAIISRQDRVDGYLLLVTSCDTTLATQAELTTVRVVCANTLRAALSRASRARVRVPHSRKFNAERVKTELGFARSEFRQFMSQMKALAEMPISRTDFEGFMSALLDVAPDATVKPHAYDRIEHLFQGGAMGASLETAAGTRWGLLNAVTEYADHHAHERSEGGRLNSAWFGDRATLKLRAVELLTG
jgi:phage/plasmid-like protein (TIGR03299 family)